MLYARSFSGYYPNIRCIENHHGLNSTNRPVCILLSFCRECFPVSAVNTGLICKSTEQQHVNPAHCITICVYML